jgi:hypothetical protein
MTLCPPNCCCTIFRDDFDRPAEMADDPLGPFSNLGPQWLTGATAPDPDGWEITMEVGPPARTIAKTDCTGGHAGLAWPVSYTAFRVSAVVKRDPGATYHLSIVDAEGTNWVLSQEISLGSVYVALTRNGVVVDDINTDIVGGDGAYVPMSLCVWTEDDLDGYHVLEGIVGTTLVQYLLAAKQTRIIAPYYISIGGELTTADALRFDSIAIDRRDRGDQRRLDGCTHCADCCKWMDIPGTLNADLTGLARAILGPGDYCDDWAAINGDYAIDWIRAASCAWVYRSEDSYYYRHSGPSTWRCDGSPRIDFSIVRGGTESAPTYTAHAAVVLASSCGYDWGFSWIEDLNLATWTKDLGSSRPDCAAIDLTFTVVDLDNYDDRWSDPTSATLHVYV